MVEADLSVTRALMFRHCIQGWSGIAEWGGLPVAELLEAVKPLPRARYLVFHSFAEGLEGGNTTTR